MLFGGKPRINMDLKCFDNAGAQLGLTIDAICQQPLASCPATGCAYQGNR